MKDLYDASSATAKTAETKDKPAIKANARAYSLLIKPLVTEKATVLGAENKYVFAVSLAANKIEIAKAIEAVYGIKPTSVNVIKLEGKLSRYGKTTGRRKNWKKAIVTLPAGKSIKVYEGV